MTFALEMAKVQRPRGTRIPKGKTTDEIIADDKIFEHARKLYRELYHYELDVDLLHDFFKMRDTIMIEKAQQTRIRNILEHHKTYATKEQTEDSREQEVQEI